MKLQTLLAGVPHKGPALDPEITAVVYDSRKAGPGALFVCLPGERADGHDYAPAAYQAGCRAFLAQRALNLPADAAQVLVPDSRSALAQVGAAFYGHPADEMHLIGITGTKGKTTTALLTAAILNGAGLPCGYIGSNGADFAGRQHHAGKPGAAPAASGHAGRRGAPLRAGGEQPGPAPPPGGRASL